MRATGAPHLVLWWPLGELLASKKQPVLHSRLQLGLCTLSFSDIKGMAGRLCHGRRVTHKKWAPGCGCPRVALGSSVVDSSCS